MNNYILLNILVHLFLLLSCIIKVISIIIIKRYKKYSIYHIFKFSYNIFLFEKLLNIRKTIDRLILIFIIEIYYFIFFNK